MSPQLARVCLAMVLLVGAVARGSARVPEPSGALFEVRDGASSRLVHGEGRVDDLLRSVGLAPVGADLAVPPGRALVRRGDGWAIESAEHPLLLGQRIDLNLAGETALMDLPRVGESRAAALVAARPYRSVEHLVRARGMGPRALGELVSLVEVHDDVPAKPVRLISLNCADQESLETLPRIGPALARRIEAARPFASVDELLRVSGIGEVTLEAIEARVHAGDCS